MDSHTQTGADRCVIRKLTPELLPDYLAYFDNRAFADNPEWSKCYCRCYYFPHHLGDWAKTSAQENRGAVCELVAAGKMHGYLAYLDGKVVGWCNAAPRVLLTPIDRDLPDPQADKIGAIACFLVEKQARGQGIAGRLLRSALDGFVERGLSIAEGYPRRDASGEARNYKGPLSMYLAAGFSIVHEEDDGTLVVRKALS